MGIVKDRKGVLVFDQMHLHAYNDTDVIWFVIHVGQLKYDKGMILYGLSNDINYIKM